MNDNINRLYAATSRWQGEYLTDALPGDAILFLETETNEQNDDGDGTGADRPRILFGSSSTAGSAKSSLTVDSRGAVADFLTCSNDLSVTGRIGVGTSEPTERLDVRGNAVQLLGTGGTNFGVTYRAINNGGEDSSGLASFECTSSGGEVAAFGCSPTRKAFLRYNGLDRLTIDRAGQVGIGTPSPRHRLHVAGGARVEGALCSGALCSGVLDVRGNLDTDGGGAIASFGSPDPDAEASVLSVRMPGTPNSDLDPDSNASFIVDSGGKVGIRTDRPLHALHVNDGNVYTNGQYLTSSDERFKTDVQIIPGALDKVLLLNGCTFRRTPPPTSSRAYYTDGRRYAGLMAQEVARVLPEVVTSDADGYMSVDYGSMMALVVEALKEVVDKLELEPRR
jgi:hypothetical protein